jgi:hypothetical protein
VPLSSDADSNGTPMHFLSVPRNGVLTAIVALTIADLLHAIRPAFIHPQNPVDIFTKLLVGALLLGPFLFGLALPLEAIFTRLCDPRLRKSYSGIAFRNDVSWYLLMGLAVFLSYRYGWLFHPNAQVRVTGTESQLPVTAR